MYNNRNNRSSSRTGGATRFNRGSSSHNRSSSGRRKSFDSALLVKKADVQVHENPYISKHSFNDFKIQERLKENITKKGYLTPTPIQDEVIPLLLNGKDVVGIANTGTGKTAAFLIPILQKINQNRAHRALIITPTRELAMQINDECKDFAFGMNIFSLICIGGANMDVQIKLLQRMPNIVIGTPGRLKDLRNKGFLNFANYDTIVLDEVDRMLDMGFINDVKYIVSYLPKIRQSMFFSATLSDNVKQVMNSFLIDPVMISVKSHETPINVDQDVVRTNGLQKIDVLHDLLIQEGFNKVLVFGRTKWGVEKLAKQLLDRGFSIVSLHGNKTQSQRKKALDSFKSNGVKILLATDVASRGLDIDNITHVINYDLPETYEGYVHRIGRTGRANKKGVALSFID